MDDPTNHCRLERGGMVIEFTGTKQFVEDMFRKVSQDLDAEPVDEFTAASKHIWVYLRGNLCHKVYLGDARDLERRSLGRFLSPDLIRRVYTDGEESAHFAGFRSDDQTLWAEFTDAGRSALQQQLKT